MKIRSIRFPRRVIQLGCALAFVAIPFANRAEINVLSGNFLAFNFAGVPLSDPLVALQVMAASLEASPGPVLIGGLLALLIAFLLGPVFCSWLCPYGFLSELLHKNKEAHASVASALSADTAISCGKKKKGQGASPVPFQSRLFIAAVGLLLAATIVPFPVLNQLSMPGWYSRTLQHVALYSGVVWGGLLLLLGMLALERFSGKRIWCSYICPQSVLISLSGLLFPARLQIAFKPKSCTCPASDRACHKACSLSLDPRHPLTVAQRARCTNCGDCVDACKDRGKALSMRFGKEKN